MINRFRWRSSLLTFYVPGATIPVPETNRAEAAPASAPMPSQAIVSDTSDYIMLTEPWEKYFRGTPKLLIIDSPSKGIRDLLAQEQSLIKTVLDSSASPRESSEYAELEERLIKLHFEVSPDRHKLHPFVLVDVTPQS